MGIQAFRTDAKARPPDLWTRVGSYPQGRAGRCVATLRGGRRSRMPSYATGSAALRSIFVWHTSQSPHRHERESAGHSVTAYLMVGEPLSRQRSDQGV
jgi:hypothetical protein